MIIPYILYCIAARWLACGARCNFCFAKLVLYNCELKLTRALQPDVEGRVRVQSTEGTEACSTPARESGWRPQKKTVTAALFGLC